MDWIFVNKEWVFSGIGVAIVSIVIGIITTKRKKAHQIQQTQTASDNANQIQASSIQTVNINGINEKRAREIYDEKFEIAAKSLSHEAKTIAEGRIASFEDKLMGRMANIEDSLSAFSDPGFQMLLIEAQKAAASTEREPDYDLLTELMIHRFKRGENRTVRAGIERAVEVVDKISDEALLGLTVLHAVGTFTPTSGKIYDGLNILENLFSKLIYGELPSGTEWLDHLDVLDAVRISNIGTMKTIEQYYPESLDGYVVTGIKKDSEEHRQAIAILKDAGFQDGMLVDHQLLEGYVRLSIVNLKSIDNMKLLQIIQPSSIRWDDITENQKSALKKVYELYSTDAEEKSRILQIFMDEWNKRAGLNKLREWWDSNTSQSIQITSVGRVLAHSNAQRCDNSLPSLD